MKNIPLYEVLSNTDTTEGRGPLQTNGYFHDRVEASLLVGSREYGRQFGIMGTSCDPAIYVRSVEIKVFKDAKDFWNSRKITVRDTALAKLTEEEKLALGLY